MIYYAYKEKKMAENKPKYKRRKLSFAEKEEYRKKNGIDGLHERDLEDMTKPLSEEEAEEMRWRIDSELNRERTGDDEDYDDRESDFYESEEYSEDDEYYDDYDDEDENGI
jgi:hypothetical protein